MINEVQGMSNTVRWGQIRDNLIRRKAEQERLQEQNADVRAKLATQLDELLSLDTDFAEMHGIDLNFLRMLDLDALFEDELYHQDVQKKLTSEIEKIFALLEGELL